MQGRRAIFHSLFFYVSVICNLCTVYLTLCVGLMYSARPCTFVTLLLRRSGFICESDGRSRNVIAKVCKYPEARAGCCACPVYFLLCSIAISICILLRRPFVLVVFTLMLYICSYLYCQNSIQNICLICYLRTMHYLHVCCQGAFLTIPTGAEYHGIRPPKRPTGICIVPGPEIYIKGQHPLRVQTAWAQFLVAEYGFSSVTPCWNFFCWPVGRSDFAPWLL